MTTRRAFLAATLASPILTLTLPAGAVSRPPLGGGEAEMLGSVAAELGALDGVVAVLELSEESRAALSPDQAEALSEALLYALKYDQTISWQAAACVAAVPFSAALVGARLAGLLDLLHARLESRARTLHI